MKTLQISGDPNCIEKAKELVTEILEFADRFKPCFVSKPTIKTHPISEPLCKDDKVVQRRSEILCDKCSICLLLKVNEKLDMIALKRKLDNDEGSSVRNPRVDYLIMHKTREMAALRQLFPRSSGIGAVNLNNY